MSALKLDAEKNISKKSQFSALVNINNKTKNSFTLLGPLSLLYDSEKKLFKSNEKVSFSFYAREVASVLSINDTGTTNFETYLKDKSVKKFPKSLLDLRKECLNVDHKVTFKALHFRELVNNMKVAEEEHKSLFMQIMSYYIIEQLLMCSSNT